MPEEAQEPLTQKSKWYDKLTKGLNGIGTLLGAVTALITAIIGLYNILCKTCGDTPPPNPPSSGFCQFKDGWIDYSQHATLPIGSMCQDGTGGVGQVVAKGSGSQIIVSAVCQFGTGWRDYAPALPYRIGTSCHDGQGNIGKIVAKENVAGPKI